MSMMSNMEDLEREIGWLLKEKYGSQMSEVAEADIARIKRGEPVAYVIGFVDFLGCKIDLSRRPLIPRAETEFWVERAINEIENSKAKYIKYLDIFAGSGCIGISILKKFREATVDFVDRESAAIEQIKINCELNTIDSSRYQIIQSDIFENVEGSYDYILANPPYIAESKKSDVQGSVLVYEPHRALFGGVEGLDCIERFLDQARKHLNKNGKIYLEFGSNQKEDIEKILRDMSFGNVEFYQDQFKKWRYLRISTSLLE